MSSEQLQSDQFQELLAEALRAGPGSPAWKQAVETVRSAGGDGEEYTMLCRAREDLESGRDYRSIKAGPGFTNKLMAEIDKNGKSRWNLASANIITGLSISVVVILATIALYFAFTPAGGDRSAAQLEEMFFTDAATTIDFRQDTPDMYTRIGDLKANVRRGLRVDGTPAAGPGYVGGGIYLKEAIGENRTVAIDTAIELPAANANLITQLFVTDKPEFAAGTGLSPHELVCLIDSGRVRVILPDGTTAGDMPLVLSEASAASLRIRMSRTAAVVEHNNKIIWSGPHQLAGSRHAGIRFLSRGGEKSGPVVAKYLRIMEP